MLTFLACKTEGNDFDLRYIEDNIWLHDKGLKVGEGDFMQFDDDKFYQLRGDTVFYKGEMRCVIYDLDTVFNILVLKGISSKGYYINTAEFVK